jgi:probable HAF family extracellular repeat protein
MLETIMDYRHRERWKVVTRRILRGCCAGATLAILASGTAAGPAPIYTAQDLGDLPGGRDRSIAYDINDSGQVVGDSYAATGRRAFLWEAGSGMTDLGDLPGGADHSYARGINHIGQVVGESAHGADSSRAFLWEAGRGMTSLGDLLPDDRFSVDAINDSGQMAGYSLPRNARYPHPLLLDTDGRRTELESLPGNEVIGFALAINNKGQLAGEIGGEFGEDNVPAEFRWAAVLWDADGRITDLGDLPGGGDSSRATGINDRGQVVGRSATATGTRAFLWEAGSGMTDLGDLPGGDDWSLAFGINDHGQVVGTSIDASGSQFATGNRSRAFLWQADLGMLQLDTLIDPLDPLYGIRLDSASAINNSGQIAATAVYSDDHKRAFLLTPVLTPRSRVLLHCSRDLSADGSVGIAVVTSDQVTIKALDGTLINQFALNGLDDLTDTELMPDTNGNGAPELVALSRSSARAVVRDLLSGADLGTIEFSAGLAAFDLELGDDQTGNGIPDLVSLGRDPMRVQVRDVLTSGLVRDVKFSSYVTGTDLEVYPDLDGSGALSLAVLAENRRPDRADKIEIRNASSGETIRQIWLGKDWLVLEQARIGDLNGNGSEEVAVLQKEPQHLGGIRVQIRDIETSAWVNFVGFANKYPPQALLTIPDLDGNGADELVVFGRHLDGLNQKAVTKDAKTGKQLSQLWFDRDFPGRDFVSCGDTNGNGSADVALLGQRPEDGQLQVMVQDARTGERLAFVWF